MFHIGLAPRIRQKGYEMSNGKRILIVDDDEDLLEMLSDQLKLHEEFQVVLAMSAAEGLEVTKQSNFDMILLDVGLPDMDGREVCRLMRRAGVRAPVPVPSVRVRYRVFSGASHEPRAGTVHGSQDRGGVDGE